MGYIVENGFEVFNKKIKKIAINKFWNNKVKILKLLFPYLFRNKKQYEYICAPDNNKTKQKKIDGLFNKGMLKDIK